MKRYLVEFVGTFFLVFTIALSGQPLAIGFMLAALVYMGAHVSGAHYNPAVTLAVWARGKMKTCDSLWYITAQFLGGCVAACAFHVLAQSNFAPAPLENVHAWEAILLEGLFTFILCSVVLVVATSKAMKNNHIYGLAIGLTLGALVMTVGQITGGAFNPAVGVSPALCNKFIFGEAVNIAHIGAYLVGPSIGGLAAAVFYSIINND